MGQKSIAAGKSSPSHYADGLTTPDNPFRFHGLGLYKGKWGNGRALEDQAMGKHQNIQSILPGLGLGILLRPLLGGIDSLCLVFLPRLGDIVGKGIVGVGSTKESLNGEEDGTNLQCGGPVACPCQHTYQPTPNAEGRVLFKTSRQIRPSRSMFGW